MEEGMFKIQNSNQRNVLGLIRKNGEISGADLTRITGQRRSTMAYILKVLEHRGLIESAGIGTTTAHGGKPPVLWKLVQDAGYMIGFEVTPYYIRTTITDFASRILYQDSHSEKEFLSDGNTKSLAEYIRSRIDALQINSARIIGVVVAIPGFINNKTGLASYYGQADIFELCIEKELNELIDLPVRILNDTNAGALGIKWFSMTPEDKNNIIFINYDENHAGIGAGFIFNGSLYTGNDGIAGEFMLEASKLDELLGRFCKDFPDTPLRKGMELEELAAHALRGDMAACGIIDEICTQVASELSRLVTLLNPSQIIIGGSLSHGGDRVLSLVTEKVKDVCTDFYPRGIILPAIRFSPYGVYSISMGATALLVDEIFNTARVD